MKLFSFKKFFIIFIGLFSFYLMFSLMTFYPFDDTYLQFSNNIFYKNAFGKLGAISSDFLFFIFGCSAYLIPLIIFFVIWSTLSKKNFLDFFGLSLKIIGSIMILLSFCGLIEFFVDDLYYCFSGGMIGYLLRINFFYLYHNDLFINIIFFIILILGMILLIGFSWLIKFKKILSDFFSGLKESGNLCNLGNKKCSSSYFLYKKNLKKLIKNGIFNNISVKKDALEICEFSSLKDTKRKRFQKKEIEYFPPTTDLLFIPKFIKKSVSMEDIKRKSKLLELKLLDYHIQSRVVNVLQGPVITRFELDLGSGVRSSQIVNLSRDLARSLSICDLKVIEMIPGTSYIGLEIPNQKREMIYLKEILDSEKFKSSHSFLTLGFGKDVFGDPIIADLEEMPHLLIAGTTGSGKSIGIHNIILSILYKSTPKDVRFIMIDPKILELSIYEGIPHLLKNVITDMKDVIDTLNWCIEEMDRRYKMMASYGVRNLKSFNNKIDLNDIENSLIKRVCSNKSRKKNNSFVLRKLPYIIIIIEEFADLMMSIGKEVESLIIRLLQKARACGIHFILVTQRPSVNVITGLIKANIPSRIAFTVSSKIDSHTILDQSGAESLLGKGDMLYLSSHSSILVRVHGAFVGNEEISSVVQYWRKFYS